jgi:hypothetical protein
MRVALSGEHYARLASDFAFADGVRIRASFEYTGAVKSHQNPPAISRLRYSAKSEYSRDRPSRSNQGEIYGKQESGKDVVDEHMLLNLKKPKVS